MTDTARQQEMAARPMSVEFFVHLIYPEHDNLKMRLIEAIARRDGEWTAALQAAEERGMKAVRKYVFELCEDTEEKCAAIAASDTDGKQGAFARGRIHEAKGIRRTVGELIAADIRARTAPAPRE